MAPAVWHRSLKRARMTCSAFAESMETLQKIRLILTQTGKAARDRRRTAPLITPALFSHRPPPDREKRENSQKQLRLGWPSGSPLSRSGGGRWERGVGGVRGLRRTGSVHHIARRHDSPPPN